MSRPADHSQPTVAALGYGVAVLAIAAAIAFSKAMQAYLHTEPFVSSLICGVVFAAWFGGAGPALLAAGLSILAFVYFIADADSLVIATTQIPRVVLFAVAIAVVVTLSTTQRAATTALRRTRDGLQAANQDLRRLNEALLAENAARERAELQLRTAEQELRTMVDTIPVGVVTFRPDGTSEFSNQTWRAYTGLSLDDLLGNRTASIHPDDLPRHDARWRDSLAAGAPFENEQRERNAAGEYRWHIIRRVPLRDGDTGEIVRWYGVGHDIEDSKRVQEALQAVLSELAHTARVVTLGEMSASIAHEVNQPLAAIAMNGEACIRWLTRDPPRVDEAMSAVRRIVDAAGRASGVVHRIRELARKADPVLVDLDINDLIEETVSIVRREMLGHQATVQLQLTLGLPEIHGDRVQLQQVIINLAINAAQAMATVASDHRRVVTIRTSRQESGEVLVAVHDTGIGVGSEDMGRLFRAFYTTKPDGMGMGLSICRSIIEAHAGRVWASRNEGPGMTFQFTLPTG